jgi:hypothetical protein
MRRCRCCDSEMTDAQEMCAACGCLVDPIPAEQPLLATLVEDLRQSQPAAKSPWGAPFGLASSQAAVCVPRRFGVGTMMILVTAFAMLLGILKSCGVPPVLFGATAAFLAGVGACQVLMFGGRDPRRASFFGGIISLGVLSLVVTSIGWFMTRDLEVIFVGIFWGGLATFVLGGPLGYAAGCLVAAIFLVRKEPGEVELPPEQSQ